MAAEKVWPLQKSGRVQSLVPLCEQVQVPSSPSFRAAPGYAQSGTRLRAERQQVTHGPRFCVQISLSRRAGAGAGLMPFQDRSKCRFLWPPHLTAVRCAGTDVPAGAEQGQMPSSDRIWCTTDSLARQERHESRLRFKV